MVAASTGVAMDVYVRARMSGRTESVALFQSLVVGAAVATLGTALGFADEPAPQQPTRAVSRFVWDRGLIFRPAG